MTQKMNIAVLYTGGTIGMQAGDNGLRPSRETVLQALQVLQAAAQFDITVCEPLIDSSQITPAHWCQWQHWLLEQTKRDVDAVLILHGTDTMAYSANVLAFGMGSVSVPIVLTGSQMPLGTDEGDAEANLQAAVQALVQGIAPKGVSVVFDGKLFAAVGLRKISTQTLDGFANKHTGVLETFGDGVWTQATRDRQTWYDGFVCPTQRGKDMLKAAAFVCTPLNDNIRIASHYCVPMAEQWALRALLESGADAVIVQSFGHGNGLFGEQDIAAIQAYQHKGGLVVNVSQVFDGHVASQYEASKALQDAQVFFAGAWTVETAYAKVWVGLSQGLKGERLKAWLSENHLGEWGA